MPDPDRLPTSLPGLVALAAGLLAASAPASGQGSAPVDVPRPATSSQAPRPKAPDPVFEAAQAAFGALPEEVRRQVQDALAWTGHYTGVTTGAFGQRTFDALLAYQRAAKLEPTGILDAPPRTTLLLAGRRARENAGFALRRDPATGVAIGVPGRLLPREEKTPQGTRWQSPDGRITLETRALDPAAGDLGATFDRLSATTPERKVTYKLKRPDFMVVTGETPTGRFYIRYATTPAGLRGFALSYDKALAAGIDPVVIAVANSFDPAPAAAMPAMPVPPAAPVAAGGRAPAAGSGAASPDAAGGRVATGLVVAAGRLLTSAGAVAACPSPRIGREPARLVATDEAAGLALLAFAGAAPVPPLPVAAEATEGDVIAFGSDRTGAVSVTPGTMAGAGRVVAALQTGAAGAPLLDRAGRLAGIVAEVPASPRLVAGIVPPLSYPVVPPATVAAFLGRQGVAATAAPAAGAPPAAGAATMTTGEIVGRLAGAIRPIFCN